MKLVASPSQRTAGRARSLAFRLGSHERADVLRGAALAALLSSCVGQEEPGLSPLDGGLTSAVQAITGAAAKDDRVVSVRDFGALGDGVHEDHEAIQRAVDALPDGGRVVFPAGSYRVRRSIIIRGDRIALTSSGSATVVVDPPDAERLKFAILVDRAYPWRPTEPVFGVRLQGLKFDVLNGEDGPNSQSVIHFNHCVDCRIEDVVVRWANAARLGVDKPRNYNGISTSQGTSGVIARVVVEGMPKTGIYIASGSHDVIVSRSEARGGDGPVGATGFAATGCRDVLFESCTSHDNRLNGMLIGVNGLDPATAEPAYGIKVSGGEFTRNGREGILLGTAAPGVAPEHVELRGVAARDNGGRGIVIEAGRDVSIHAAAASGNGNQGILVSNVSGAGGSPRVDDLTSRIRIVEPVLRGNGAASPASAITIRAARDVTVHGGTFEGDADEQARTIDLWPFGDYRPTNLEIVHVDVLRGFRLRPGGAAPSGHYRISGAGDPNFYDVGSGPTGLPAPVGSRFIDTETGRVYRKASAWNEPKGWLPL